MPTLLYYLGFYFILFYFSLFCFTLLNKETVSLKLLTDSSIYTLYVYFCVVLLILQCCQGLPVSCIHVVPWETQVAAAVVVLFV